MIRVASAVALIALAGVTIWLLPLWATAAIAAAAAARAAFEVARLARTAGAAVPAGFVALAAATLTLAFVFSDPRVPGAAGPSLGAVVVALVVVAGSLALALGPPTASTLTTAAVMVMAPIYVGLPLGAIVWVQAVGGAKATTWLLAVVAASDSAQYYTGRRFGRTKLAPAISPAKTNEGAVGGLVAAAAVGGALAPYCLPALSRLESAGIAAVLATFGMAGDLFESLLKRSVGAKDAAALIPGHGGLLDCIDAHLFAAPVFYLVLRYVS